MLKQNITSSNPSDDIQEDNPGNNNNTETPQAQQTRENQGDSSTSSSVQRISKNLNISDELALHILTQCDRCIVNAWQATNPVLTAEVAQFYEVSKQEVIAASNKYSGELESNVSCQFTARDVLHVGMFLDSPIATVMRLTLLDYIEAWGKEAKRERILKLLENENIAKWSDSAIARIAACSRSYVSKSRKKKPEEIEVVRGDSVLQMKRKKSEPAKKQEDLEEIQPENQVSSPHHVNNHMVQGVAQNKINRTWTQAEYDEAIAQINEQHFKEISAIEKQVVERISSEFERERLKEVEGEKEEYRLQLEIALNKIDEYQSAAAEIEQLKEMNSRLSQQIEDLGKELQRKSAPTNEVISKKAEVLMREEFKKQFGNIDPELHLEALAVQQPKAETPQKKAFIKRVAITALASIAAMFPTVGNIQEAAAAALQVEPEQISFKASRLNRVSEAIAKIEKTIGRIGCTADELDWCVEPYQDIKKYIWDEMAEVTRVRCSEIKKSPTATATATATTPWEESRTWQFKGRVAKYNGEDKTLSWGLQLVKIDLSTICDDWESPQVWLMNFAGSEIKLKEGGNAIVIDQDSRYFEQEVTLRSTEDGDWWECVTSTNAILKFYKEDLKAV